MRKLPDEEACKRLLIRTREKSKKAIKTKTISLKIAKENEKNITAVMVVHHQIKTGNVVLSHGLSYADTQIFPNKNKKRNCKGERGKEILKNHRERLNKAASKYKAFYSTYKICEVGGGVVSLIFYQYMLTHLQGLL